LKYDTILSLDAKMMERSGIMELEKYTQYQETQKHGHPGFPYDTYLCTIPLDFPRVDIHWHDQMEIIYVKKGKGVVSVNLHAYSVYAGCIIPVLPGELHSIERDGQETMEYENIIFSLSILDSAEPDDWCRHNVINALKQGSLRFERPIRPGTDFHNEASSALDGADMACEKQMRGYSLIVKSQLFLFLHALFCHRDRSEQQTAAAANTEKLKELLTYIKEHYHERVTVADAAAAAGYSQSHFMRVFKQETGRTFNDYLVDYRLSAAVYYLRETDHDVSTIAGMCGFDNISYFIRRFRNKYGISPGKYRGKACFDN